LPPRHLRAYANGLLCAALFRLGLRACSILRDFRHEGVTAMTSQNDSAPSRVSAASRRDFVTAATAVAAASAAAATGSAQAQAEMNVRHSNPPGMTQPTAYSQVVEVNGPHRLVFVAGQTGVDASGKAAQGFRAQAVQVFENIKTALALVGAIAKCAPLFSPTKAHCRPQRCCKSRASPIRLSSSRWMQRRSYHHGDSGVFFRCSGARVAANLKCLSAPSGVKVRPPVGLFLLINTVAQVDEDRLGQWFAMRKISFEPRCNGPR
jgi:enamine deaminase RidA (YjgF/YER057c/UK114 family)